MNIETVQSGGQGMRERQAPASLDSLLAHAMRKAEVAAFEAWQREAKHAPIYWRDSCS
jgi:hypothetical protein